MNSNNQLPDYLSAGESSRLIPILSEGSKEGRATSILLSNINSVHEFSQALFGAIGIRIGQRAQIETYTEIVFKDKSDTLRPDGLVVIKTGRSEWRALIEAKIGKNDLEENQIKDYLALAKKYKIDAVITISNQYSSLPTHHPISLKKSDLKGINLFHWSWMFILTEAILLLKNLKINDTDQHYILKEMTRYFDHPSVGVASFTSMNKEWKDINQKIRNNIKLNKTSDEVENTISSWHQEARDLCLIMSRKLSTAVAQKLSRKYKNSPVERLKDDSNKLVQEHILSCELEIPDTASLLTITADLTRRTITCSMKLDAPKDKKRLSAKVNWLLKQLKNTKNEDTYITLITAGRGENLQLNLPDLKEDSEAALNSSTAKIDPTAFEISIIKDLAGKFSSRKAFIEELESIVPIYYEEIGQHLKAWIPPAPKISKTDKPTQDPQKEAS